MKGFLMKSRNTLLIIVAMMMALFLLNSSTLSADDTKAPSEKLLVVLTTGDKEVISKMVLPYTLFAKKNNWFGEVCLLLWGPSDKTVVEDQDLQNTVKQLKEVGVQLLACKWCAEQYAVDKKLQEIGFKVEYMGQPLSDMIKGGWKVLSF
jgi:hypothetical protein